MIMLISLQTVFLSLFFFFLRSSIHNLSFYLFYFMLKFSGISLRTFFVDKRERGWYMSEKLHYLSIEDPADSSIAFYLLLF